MQRLASRPGNKAKIGIHAPPRPKEWWEKYAGEFDLVWDKQRELTHAKQLEMGLIPKGTKLTPRVKEIPAWDSQSAEARKVYSRLMENYAAYMAYTDAEVGRLIESLLGIQLGLESTLKRIDEIGGPKSEPHVPAG